MATFQVAKGGLMGGVSVGGQKFSYKPREVADSRQLRSRGRDHAADADRARNEVMAAATAAVCSYGTMCPA